jgi:hypothetical protein
LTFSPSICTFFVIFEQGKPPIVSTCHQNLVIILCLGRKWSLGFDGKWLLDAYICAFLRSTGILPQCGNVCMWVKIMKIVNKYDFYLAINIVGNNDNFCFTLMYQCIIYHASCNVIIMDIMVHMYCISKGGIFFQNYMGKRLPHFQPFSIYGYLW